MLTFNADRTVDVTLDDGTTIRLRPPTIDEWRKLFTAYTDAEEAITLTAPREQAQAMWGNDTSPLAEAFAMMCELLGSTATLDANKLPMWCGTLGIFARLYHHWRVIPVAYVEGLHDPLEARLPAGEPEPAPTPSSPLSTRPAADGDADIPQLDLDELANMPPQVAAPAGAPPIATGYVGPRSAQGM